MLPRLFQKKARSSLKERLGLKAPELRSDKPERIWVHAVSVGEAKAVIPLVKRLRDEKPEAFIVFTTTTKTGLNEVEKGCLEADRAFLMPLDFFTAKLVQEMRPTLVILSETDFWFNFLSAAKKSGAKVVLVNGKMSQKSYQRYRFFKPLFKLIDAYIVQADIYKQRFIDLGVPEEKLTVSGNLKLDKAAQEPDPLNFKDPVLVIGSTHAPEEKLFLDVVSKVWENTPNLKVYIVPRHPERFDQVAKLIENKGVAYTRSSKKETGSEKLVLVDEMGKLNDLYHQATITCVAGSWTPKVGGHNILEPSFFGRPVIFGPYMHTQPELVEMVKASEAGIQVDEFDLKDAIENLIQNPYQAKAFGKRGFDLVRQSTGALTLTLNTLKQIH